LKEDGAHVAVDPVALRALAGPAATEQWDEGFAGMCAYAAGKGWVEADGGVLAHIERRDEPGWWTGARTVGTRPGTATLGDAAWWDPRRGVGP
jgi:hypothetical protein